MRGYYGIAGGMTEASRGNDSDDMKDHASSPTYNARINAMLGDKAKLWEEYAQETLALIREHCRRSKRLRMVC